MANTVEVSHYIQAGINPEEANTESAQVTLKMKVANHSGLNALTAGIKSEVVEGDEFITGQGDGTITVEPMTSDDQGNVIHIVEGSGQSIMEGAAEILSQLDQETAQRTGENSHLGASGPIQEASTYTEMETSGFMEQTSEAMNASGLTELSEGQDNNLCLMVKTEKDVEVGESLIEINKRRLREMGEPHVITIETRKQGHECIVCKQRFSQLTALYRHRVSHNEEVVNLFKCETCHEAFNEPLELEKHRQLHLDKRVFKCVICQEIYTELANYKCHLRIHDKQAEYSCDICPFTVFSERRHYIAHLDDHDLLKSEFIPGRPLQLICNMCNRVFAERYQLKRHQAYHHSEKCYKCNICSKAFVERSKLTRHMVVHTGKKEYYCPVCDKAFSLKHNLNAHIKIHDNLRPWECGICRRTFIQKVCLQRHLKVHEGYTIEYEERNLRV